MADEAQEEELDPRVEAIRRRLTRLLLVSGGIMLLGLVAVFAAIVYRVGGSGSEPETARNAEFRVPAGAEIISTALSQNRVALTLRLTDGSREVRIFLANGSLAATYTISEE